MQTSDTSADLFNVPTIGCLERLTMLDAVVDLCATFKETEQTQTPDERKRKLSAMVKQITDAMPEHVAQKEVGLEVKRLRNSLANAVQPTGKSATIECSRWQEKIASLSETLAPTAPYFQAEFFQPHTRDVKPRAGKNRIKAFEEVALRLDQLVSCYESMHPSETRAYPTLEYAIEPYRVGIHLYRLAQVMNSSMQPETIHQAIDGFLQNSLHASFLSSHERITKLMKSAKASPELVKALKHSLRIAAAENLLPSSLDLIKNYSEVLVTALQEDLGRLPPDTMITPTPLLAEITELYWASTARDVANSMKRNRTSFQAAAPSGVDRLSVTPKNAQQNSLF